MVSQCTTAVKMMPSTPDSFGKQFLPYHYSHKDCEWTYFSNCRLIAAGHMLPKLLKTISVGSYYHVQMDFRRPGENSGSGLGFISRCHIYPSCPRQDPVDMNTKLYSVFEDVVITRAPDRHGVPTTLERCSLMFSLCFLPAEPHKHHWTDISAGPITWPL